MASGVYQAVADKEMAANLLLLFISALIPKALGSLLTSLLIQLSQPENVRAPVPLTTTS